jgi:hypothetical protein
MSEQISSSEQPQALAQPHQLTRNGGASARKAGPGKMVGVVIALAAGSGVLLLINDGINDLWPTFKPLAHAPISALPLLLIGLASLVFQAIIRPGPLDLLKAMIVSAAFILWGIDQLLPSGQVATTLGDLVIVLYVIDLGWMMADRLRQQGQARRASQEEAERMFCASEDLSRKNR